MYIYKLYILTLYFYICRYEMTELRKRKDNDVGFVDPNVVFKHPNPTTTQTLVEASVFGFPRRAKPSAAA